MVEIPRFGIGQTEGVRTYLEAVFPELCVRLNVAGHKEEELLRMALASLDASAAIMATSLTAGVVDPLPEARRFWNAIGEEMLAPESRLEGADNLMRALAAMERGQNVLLVQNHRSGADTMVMEILVNRLLGEDIVTTWAYMSGHAVNLYLIPLMFTTAMRRFQIFSAKYRSTGVAGADEEAMRRQNTRAMLALRRYCARGGRLVGCYPEGGRGEHSMKKGEPRIVCVPEVMASGGKELLVLPTYVDGATSLLPVRRGENEYNEIFHHAQRGTATLTIGSPIPWSEICPSVTAVRERADAIQHQQGERHCEEAARDSLRIDMLLGLVAALAPNDSERGPYATPEMQALTANLARGG